MRIATIIFISLVFYSCNGGSNSPFQPKSLWSALKDSFSKQNLNEFKLDKELFATYRNLHRIESNRLDSTLSNKWSKVYLYSWQVRDSRYNEFTTIIQEEDRGVRIVYYIFDQNDSLLSATKVAHGSMEAEYEFVTHSRFKDKDMLLTTMAMTQVYDMGTRTQLKETKGDTLVVEYLINKDGSTSEDTIKNKRELTLDD